MSDREAEAAEDASVDPVADRVQVNDAVDDATVMVDDSTVMVDDATRAVSRAEADDLTKVVARPADAAVDDATVVSASRSASGPQDESDSLEDSVPSAAIVHAGSASHGTFADYMSGSRGTSTSGTGLDPKRRIARVPDRMPWEVAPTAEAGVHQGLPVVYGPRDLGEAGSVQGLDEIHRRIGPAPAASPVPVREGREALPSLERRERKRRTATLIMYGGVVVVALLGLWGVAVLAFG